MNLNALILCLKNFFLRGGHGIAWLQAIHGYALRPAAPSSARHVDSHIAAADHDCPALHGVSLLFAYLAQKIYGGHHAVGLFARNPDHPAALAANRYVEGLVALPAQLVDREILANLNAAPDFYAHLAQNFNFCIHHILLQLIGGDAVNQHAARALILFKHGGLVAFFRQIIRAAQSCRARADNRNFFREQATVRGLNDRRNIAVLRIQILLGDEFFHLVNGNRLIDRAAGAGILTAAVTYAAAHGGEWVFLFNQGKGVTIAPLCSHF